MGPPPIDELIRGTDHVRRPVEQSNAERICSEHRDKAITDQVDDRLKIELLRQGRSDLVDDRQLGCALLRFGQQPLRLVEQARVLERNAHARGDRRHELLIALGERVRSQLRDREHADVAFATRDRHAEVRLLGLRVEITGQLPTESLGFCECTESKRCAGAEHMGCQPDSDRNWRNVVLALAVLQPVRES